MILGVEINIMDPIVEVCSTMDGGVRVGEVHDGFVEMYLESLVTKLAN